MTNQNDKKKNSESFLLGFKGCHINLIFYNDKTMIN